MNDFISKPMKPGALQNALLRCLRLRDQETRVRESAATVHETVYALAEELGQEEVSELLGDYLDELPNWQDKIRNFLDSNELRSVSREAHSFKGLALTYGMERAAAIASEVELKVEKLEREEVLSLLSGMFEAVECSEPELRDCMAQLRSGAG